MRISNSWPCRLGRWETSISRYPPLEGEWSGRDPRPVSNEHRSGVDGITKDLTMTAKPDEVTMQEQRRI